VAGSYLEFPGRAAAQARAEAPPEASWDGAKARLDEDLLVVGDNLDALKLLRRTHEGALQLVYADPPYNRAGELIYDDALGGKRSGRAASTMGADRHGPWLAMMLPRLLALRPLLRPDALVCMSIDDAEVHGLRWLMDEVFGPAAFMAQVVVVVNPGGRDYLPVAQTHEYVLVYGGPQARIREVPRMPSGRVRVDARGPYELRDLRNRNPRFHPENRPTLAYPLWVTEPAGTGGDGQLLEVHGAALEGAVEVRPLNVVGGGSVWRWGRAKVEAALVAGDLDASDVVAKRRPDGGVNIYEKLRKSTTKLRSVWADAELRTEVGTRELRAALGAPVFDHPKPVELVRRCVALGTDPDGVVLDLFAGSGTTAAAVHAQNGRDGGARRCILVQLPAAVPPGSVAARAGYRRLDEITYARWSALPEVRPFRRVELRPVADPGTHGTLV
jgi:adenine-specific DNA-methyltransferase